MLNSSIVSDSMSENITGDDLKSFENHSINELDLVKDSFQLGDRVEAKFRGKAKRYYKGIVKAVHSDGTYDIDYDDGDRDRQLLGAFIRLLPTVNSKMPPEDIIIEKQEHSVGMVERSFDSTNDVDKATVSSPSTRTFKVGERVEARFKGRGTRYYAGTIKVKRSNGTYDIDYDDGDTDKSLASEAIRPISNTNTTIVLTSHRNGQQTKLKVIENPNEEVLSDATHHPLSTTGSNGRQKKGYDAANDRTRTVTVPSSIVTIRDRRSVSNSLDGDGAAKNCNEGFKAGDKVSSDYFVESYY